MRRIGRVLLLQIILYLGLFILIPRLPFDEILDVVICLSYIIIISYITVKSEVQVRYYALGIFVMWGLILAYHPSNLYGLTSVPASLHYYLDSLSFAFGIFLLQISFRTAKGLLN